MLGPGNEEAALAAVQAYPGGLQVGGGITSANAQQYLTAGASHVIVTSYVFRDGVVDFERLAELVGTIGKECLVLDLSCRRRGDEFVVVTDRWTRFTDFVLTRENVKLLEGYCDEFLVHGVDVEGKRCGIDTDLVRVLGEWCSIPVTYAGGVRDIGDLDLLQRVGGGRVNFTIGSALDIFGGELPLADVLAWRDAHAAPPSA